MSPVKRINTQTLSSHSKQELQSKKEQISFSSKISTVANTTLFPMTQADNNKYSAESTEANKKRKFPKITSTIIDKNTNAEVDTKEAKRARLDETSNRQDAASNSSQDDVEIKTQSYITESHIVNKKREISEITSKTEQISKPTPRTKDIHNCDDSSDPESSAIKFNLYNPANSFEKFYEEELSILKERYKGKLNEEEICNSFILHALGNYMIHSPEIKHVYYNEFKSKYLNADIKKVEDIKNIMHDLTTTLIYEQIKSVLKDNFDVIDKNSYSKTPISDAEFHEFIKSRLFTSLKDEVDKAAINLARQKGIFSFKRRNLEAELIKVRKKEDNEANKENSEDIFFSLTLKISNTMAELEKNNIIVSSGPMCKKKVTLSESLSNLFNNDFEEKLEKAIEDKIFCQMRTTLENKLVFDKPKNITELIAISKVINRSIRREFKNFKFSQGLIKKKYLSLYWKLFSTLVSNVITIYRSTKSRTDLIPHTGTYDQISTSITKQKKELNDKGICKLNQGDKLIATCLREIINGKTELSLSIPNNQNPSFKTENIYKLLDKLALLICGVEIMRSPAALINSQMMLDLIIAEKLTWAQAFTDNGTKQFASGGIMPMSFVGAVKTARTLEKIFSHYTLGSKKNYPGPNNATLDREIDMIQRESHLLNLWLSNNFSPADIPRDNKAKYEKIMELISNQSPKWFNGLQLLNHKNN